MLQNSWREEHLGRQPLGRRRRRRVILKGAFEKVILVFKINKR
jgi:hypothetical protein